MYHSMHSKLFKVPAEVYKYCRPTGRGRDEEGEGAGRGAARLRAGPAAQRPSLHDGPVDDGLNVVLPVAGVDDALPLGVLLDVALLEELEAHVRRHRLGTPSNGRKQLETTHTHGRARTPTHTHLTYQP